MEWTDEYKDFMRDNYQNCKSVNEFIDLFYCKFGINLGKNAIVGAAKRQNLKNGYRQTLKQYASGFSNVKRIKYENGKTPARAVHLLYLNYDQCRYVYGEPQAAMCCGEPIHSGGPYCAKHTALCYTAGTGMSRKELKKYMSLAERVI